MIRHRERFLVRWLRAVAAGQTLDRYDRSQRMAARFGRPVHARDVAARTVRP